MKIERKGKTVTIKSPVLQELDYIASLWADQETMRDVGGPYILKDEKRADWFSRMVEPGNGKNAYCLIYDREQQHVGEVSFHKWDPQEKTAEFNIKIEAAHRGNNYGMEAMLLMLQFYFNEFGGEMMRDPVALQNKGGQRALIQAGFTETERTEEYILYELSKQRFQTFNTTF